MVAVAGGGLACRLLTPPGAGAIAVIRVSGPGAWPVVCKHVRGRGGELPAAPRAGRLYRGTYDDGVDAIDDVLVTHAGADERDDGPVDISCHGGVRVVERILLSLTADGAVLSDEDSAPDADRSWQDRVRQRAHELLTRATTRRAALFLLAQAQLLPAQLERIRRLAESGDTCSARAELSALVSRSRGAHYLYRPAEVAVVGPPNAGKSLLANRLAGREGAIVTARPGTTRDWVLSSTAIEGVAVNLIDTAGVRRTDDALEREAVEAGRNRAAAADVVVLVLDGSVSLPGDLRDAWRAGLRGRAALIALNKSDLAPLTRPGELAAVGAFPVISVSALTGAGCDNLRAAILSALRIPSAPEGEAVVFDSAWRERLEVLGCTGAESGKALAEGVCRAVTGG